MRIAIALAVGALVNLAFTCVLAATLDPAGLGTDVPPDTLLEFWQRSPQSEWPPRPDHAAVARHWGVTAHDADALWEGHGIYHCYEASYGWPLRAASWEEWGSPASVLQLHVVGFGAAVTSAAPYKPSRFEWFPARPMWLGILGNSIVYALVTWLGIVGFGRVRRARRLRGGFCPRCTYRVGEASTCSECGCPLP